MKKSNLFAELKRRNVVRMAGLTRLAKVADLKVISRTSRQHFKSAPDNNWLEQTYRDRDGNNLSYIRTDSLLTALRGDPRCGALAEKIVPAS